MDVDFVYDTYEKQHQLHISGEHVAVARFLNEIFIPKRGETAAIESFILEIENKPETITFAEWTLTIEGDELLIQHNSCYQPANIKAEDSNESSNLMDWEMKCHCGVADFTELLVNWVDFIEST
ncbi:YacL family protein [Psychrosphaera sp.]|nr:YacL family protein [Psychrosphaera sp.]